MERLKGFDSITLNDSPNNFAQFVSNNANIITCILNNINTLLKVTHLWGNPNGSKAKMYYSSLPELAPYLECKLKVPDAIMVEAQLQIVEHVQKRLKKSVVLMARTVTIVIDYLCHIFQQIHPPNTLENSP